jgi:hypothetical protein
MSAFAATLFAVTVGSAAFGQPMTLSQRKCSDAMNKASRNIANQEQKHNRSSIKDGSGDVDMAIDQEAPKNAGATGKRQKLIDIFAAGGKCNGNDNMMVAKLPTYGVNNDPNDIADQTEGGSDDYIRGVWGDPVDGIVPKTTSTCHDKIAKRLGKKYDAQMKAFRKCQKDLAIIDDLGDIEACVPTAIGDAKAVNFQTLLVSDMASKCTFMSPPPGTDDGACSTCTNAATCGACFGDLVDCQACLAMNNQTGVFANCDVLDDGANNGSCVVPLPLHKCALTGGGTNSYVNIYSAAFPVPISFDTSGSSIDIGGGGSLGACAIQNFNPIFIIGIGFVCINPSATPCANLTRNCTGSGVDLGIDVRSDGNVGACTGNPDCEAQCVGHCAGLGAGFSVLNGGCTGYCTEGDGNTVCTADAVCDSLMPSEGSCNGPDNLPMAQQNICQCSCIKTDAFGDSVAGDVQCNLGSDLTVEMAGPCNGTDTLINVGNTCIPVTTQRAKGRIVDGNFVAMSTVPAPGTMCVPPGMPDGSHCNDQTGAPLACATVDSSDTTGLVGVGAVNFFGSTIGDLTVGLKATCL